MREIAAIVTEAFRLQAEGKIDEAIVIYDKILGMMDRPDANALVGYGTAMSQKGQPGLASVLLRAALRDIPEYAPLWANLGVTMKTLGRDETAFECYTEALRLDPDEPHALSSLAGWSINRGDTKKALEYSYKAVKADPASAQAHNHLGLALLEAGRFAEAWPHYEHRWGLQDKIKNVRPYTAPRWDGKRVGILAIHGEQGLGDEILFMAGFREAAKRADRIVIECATRLVPWFSESFGVPCYPNHAELIAAEGEPDAYIPMGSLWSVTGLPDGKPYLKRPCEAVPGRIGIAWRGGTQKTNKRERTLRLEDLRPILDVQGFEFVSVQYGGTREIGEATSVGLSAYEGDFDDLTELIASCELVITVCQTAVHQAGAMGIPCWVLTPKKCAWRYCGPDERMRFYDSVRLFRQDDSEEWSPVIQEIAQALDDKRSGRQLLVAAA